jgi:putative CocE/NonD family hydrolase
MNLRQIVRALSIIVLSNALFPLIAGNAQTSSEDDKQVQSPGLHSEIPSSFRPVLDSFDFIKRDEQIPMRDGVTLHTVILIPKSGGKTPILLTRSPFNAGQMTDGKPSSRMGVVLHDGLDNPAGLLQEGRYIRAVQDIRGKYTSGGEYVMNRPLHGTQNPTSVDESTDAYDTIDWLVKHIPESNGKVGIIGTSYDGFLSLMAAIHPHPALKVAIAQNPMVDGWMGDDWFHFGAFRQPNMAFIYSDESSSDSSNRWWTSHFDSYGEFLEAGSAGELGKSHGLDQLGFWRKMIDHPSYDKFWQEQAVDKIMANEPLAIPVMLVHGLWDQEDIYGAPAVYKAIKPKDADNNKVFFVIGPWYHGQEISDTGASLGAIKFHSETAAHYRDQILRPFLDNYLQDDSHKSEIAPVNAFETGTNVWRKLRKWPSGCDDGCVVQPAAIYLGANYTLDFNPKQGNEAAFDEYVSDPSKPIPFQSLPIPTGDFGGTGWSRWLVDDQRNVATRPDVLSYVSSPLTKPLKISGQPMVHLTASTSGSDSDWVVKLIDVFPPEVADQAEMGGYQLMVAADIFRARYRESFENPTALPANVPLSYNFALPTANHVFLPGHRLMVQIQSSWFPLYDRNPQKFVPNIFLAKPEDYQKATQRIYRSSRFSSSLNLPVVSP